jgi:hypothetical protein
VRKSYALSVTLLRQGESGAVNDGNGSGGSDGSAGHGDRAVDKVSKASSVPAPARTAPPNAVLSARRLVGGGGGPSSGSHAGDAVTEDSGGFDSTPPPRSSRSIPSRLPPPTADADPQDVNFDGVTSILWDSHTETWSYLHRDHPSSWQTCDNNGEGGVNRMLAAISRQLDCGGRTGSTWITTWLGQAFINQNRGAHKPPGSR